MLDVVLWTQLLLSPLKEGGRYHPGETTWLGSCEGTCHSISAGTQGSARPQGLGWSMSWAQRKSSGVGWRDVEQLIPHLASVLI